MVRTMDLRAAIQGLAYDIKLKLDNEENPEILLAWIENKVAKTRKHWDTNKAYRHGEIPNKKID